jgi:hypothetical protein
VYYFDKTPNPFCKRHAGGYRRIPGSCISSRAIEEERKTMFRKIYAAPLAALILTAAAPAAPTIALASNQDQQNVTGSSDDSDATPKAERKTCKYLADSASRMRGKRLCMTAAQWRQFYAAQQD